MELTLHESTHHKLVVDLFEACLSRQHEEDSPFPDAVFSLTGERQQTEYGSEPIYKVLVSAPDDQAKIANAFAMGYATGWHDGRVTARRRRWIRRRRS